MPKIKDIIKRLEETTKRNEKKNILQQNKDNDIFKETLHATYNPYIDYYIVKLPKMKTGTYEFEDLFDDFKILLDKLSNRDISGNVAIDETVKLFSKYQPEDQKIAIQVLKRKFTKAGINTKTINSIFPDLIPEFDVQLANVYDVKKKDKYSLKFISTPKLDGIRCIYLRDKGLFTRKGRKIHIFPEIEEDCKKATEEFDVDFIDGELWSPDLDFNNVQSAVMSDKNIKDEIKNKISLNCFAVGNQINSIDMMKAIDKISKKYNKINSLEWKIINNNIEEIVRDTLDKLKNGFEGIILRSISLPYIWKRSDDLLKVKDLQLFEMMDHITDSKLLLEIKPYTNNLEFDDFKVTEVLEGEGNFKGMLGSLKAKGIVEGKEIEVKVGSGFDLQQRKDLWEIKDQLIGKEIVILCQEVTKYDSLRFPVFKAIKLDR